MKSSIEICEKESDKTYLCSAHRFVTVIKIETSLGELQILGYFLKKVVVLEGMLEAHLWSCHPFYGIT